MVLLMNSFFEAFDLFEVATQPFDTLSTHYFKGAADTQQLIFVELTLITIKTWELYITEEWQAGGFVDEELGINRPRLAFMQVHLLDDIEPNGTGH